MFTLLYTGLQQAIEETAIVDCDSIFKTIMRFVTNSSVGSLRFHDSSLKLLRLRDSLSRPSPSCFGVRSTAALLFIIRMINLAFQSIIAASASQAIASPSVANNEGTSFAIC